MGINTDARKLLKGYRNLGGITTLIFGDCCHKDDPSPEAKCATRESCADHVGAPHHTRYGQPQAYQTGNGFTKHPVERQTDSCNRDAPNVEPCGYNLTFATNAEQDWNGNRFKYAGPMEVCVSMKNLDFWFCRNGTMRDDGKMENFQAISTRAKTPDELRGLKIPKGFAEPHPKRRQLGPPRSAYSGFPDIDDATIGRSTRQR